jgi:hypothetical protein
VIETTKGPMDEALLQKKEGVLEDDNETTAWVEYWDGDELVHRSAHVTLKKWPEGLGAIAAQFGS